MTIKQFSEKYHVSRRKIDYWTNIGCLHPTFKENNYRDYGENCEKEMKLLIIFEAAGFMAASDFKVLLERFMNGFLLYDYKYLLSMLDEEQKKSEDLFKFAKAYLKDIARDKN